MHNPRMLMHKRTMILHGCSIEMQIATKFYKFLPKEENFLLSIACFPHSLLILRERGEGVPIRFSPFPLFY